MPAQDRHVTAHLAQCRQRMLQQRASVECDRGFVLPHTRALAARKNKARKLGVDHCGYCTPLGDLYMVFKELDFCRLGGRRLSFVGDLGTTSKIYFLVNPESCPLPLPMHPT